MDNKKKRKNSIIPIILAFFLFAMLCVGCSTESIIENESTKTTENTLVTTTKKATQKSKTVSKNKIKKIKNKKIETKSKTKAKKSNKKSTEKKKVKLKYVSKKLKLSQIPKYKYVNHPFVKIDKNIPVFNNKEIKKVSYQKFSPLDKLGRCGMVIACIGKDIMPKKKRGNISAVRPSGWHTYTYNNVEGGYLYNRCHLIGYQLTGQNANPRNLITGTRFLNINGMLDFENRVAGYVRSTGNHVMYRVTPMYKGNNLVASGVHMEGYSVEDKGKGICFNVFCYNIQPGVKINYANGTSSGKGLVKYKFNRKSSSNNSYNKSVNQAVNSKTGKVYVVSINTKKFHVSTCRAVKMIKPKNKMSVKITRNKLINQGYTPCKICNP